MGCVKGKCRRGLVWRAEYKGEVAKDQAKGMTLLVYGDEFLQNVVFCSFGAAVFFFAVLISVERTNLLEKKYLGKVLCYSFVWCCYS